MKPNLSEGCLYPERLSQNLAIDQDLNLKTRIWRHLSGDGVGRVHRLDSGNFGDRPIRPAYGRIGLRLCRSAGQKEGGAEDGENDLPSLWAVYRRGAHAVINRFISHIIELMVSKTSLSFSINNGVSNGSDMHPSRAFSNMSKNKGQGFRDCPPRTRG